MKKKKTIIISLLGVISVFIGGGVPFFLFFYQLQQEIEHKNIKWEQFKVQHHCNVVSEGSGVFGNTKGWLCDNGITYYAQ